MSELKYQNHKKLLEDITTEQISSFKTEEVIDLKISDYLTEEPPSEDMTFQDLLILAAKKEKEVKHQYVGVSKCAMCHKSKARGNQVGQWKETAHAKAYTALATEAAKETGKKLGVEDPQKSPKCLKCHVTAYGVEKELLGSKYSVEDGVGCESCHGPGSRHVRARRDGADDAASMSPAVVLNRFDDCLRCHRAKPSHRILDRAGFDRTKAWAHIRHGLPKSTDSK